MTVLPKPHMTNENTVEDNIGSVHFGYEIATDPLR